MNKPYSIEFTENCDKEFGKLDKPIQQRITNYLSKRVAKLENPRMMGEPLHGTLSHLWRYKVGNYRIICEIQDSILRVLVIRIDHRRQVYRQV